MQKHISTLKTTIRKCERYYTLSPALFGKGNILSTLSSITDQFNKEGYDEVFIKEFLQSDLE